MIEDRLPALGVLRAADSSARVSYYPPTFDSDAVASQFDQLAERIQSVFHCSCDRSPQPQDSALHDLLGLPTEATGASDTTWILVSNFTPLAMYHVGQVRLEAPPDMRSLLRREVIDQIEAVLSDSGYTTVPNSVLWETYDGVHEGIRRINYTWFKRFFDYH